MVKLEDIGKHCMGCEERRPACHDTCEKYLSIKKKWEEEKDHIRHEKKKDAEYMDAHIQGIRRMMR